MIVLATQHEAQPHRCNGAVGAAAHEQPVLPVHRAGLHRPFPRVVVGRHQARVAVTVRAALWLRKYVAAFR